MRLIDADALKESIKDQLPTYPLRTQKGFLTYGEMNIMEHIDAQPTIETEPRGMVVFREGDKLMHIDQDALVELWRMAQRGELVEVVRCRDCKLYYPEYDGGINCGLDNCVTADDFCSQAERKDGVEE